ILSGYGRITDLSGGIINVTVGWPAGLGRANNYQRYIIDANSKATITFTQDSVVSVSNAVETQFTVSPFSDVKKSDWYFNSVVGAYSKGLISGMTATTYEPLGTLTVAQAIRLAAAMYQLYHDGEVTLKKSDEGQWYESFVKFAFEKGIIEERYTTLSVEEYNAPINRSEFVHIFYSALPEETYIAINDIPDNAIPDVTLEDAYADEIYTFYRAGIVSGYTNSEAYAEHAFGSDSTITRAEVASILIRMFEPAKRSSFTIE
ncbi:MAG: S-layer homology domain-containing protein, partial [Oscillospiraceae bacterium]|nr:S-layer homology domain-containing protein [Oscillospiraceae bacterium]